jgi:Acetyltransferase (GNAT) domain
LDCASQQPIDAMLLEMSQKHLADYETFWKQRLARSEEDAHWNWDKKYEFLRLQPSYEKYAVEVKNITQGLMFIELDMHRSRLDEGKNVVYVEYLSTAPWNRASAPARSYRGIGSGLLSYAIERSVELEYGGRVGLHALPRAKGFYEGFGMKRFGPDAEKEALEYFEMASDKALEIRDRFMNGAKRSS